ncbi:MAG: LptF/LptG family permease [Bacteroidales bacterium]|jgi:lipopolysaccharide export system permease protein|nr:LptF/LptG family permease [Bacteroidales bacterium]
MKIVYRYFIKKFMGPFVITFFFALVILLMQFLWLYVDDLVGKGLEIKLILELLLYASATMVAMAAPLAVLLASLMTFGSLGEHYELVALKSAGISIHRLMLPVALLALLIGVSAFFFTDKVSPKAWYKMKSLFYNIKDQKPALAIEEGTFYNEFDNYTIRVGKKHRDNETIEDIIIYDHSKYRGNITMTYATRGRMTVTPDGKYMLFLLQDGFFWDESSNGNNQSLPLTRARFKEQYKRFDLSSFNIKKDDNNFYRSNTKAMSIEELNGRMDSIKKDINGISDRAIEQFFATLYFFNNAIMKDTVSENNIAQINPCAGLKAVLQTRTEEERATIFRVAEQSARNMLNTIKYAYEEATYKNEDLWSHQIEWHRKFTSATACLLFFFIGASLGSIIRKGGIGIPLLITVIFFVTYFAISVLGEKVAKSSSFPVSAGMWLSSFILLPISIFLVYKASTDSVLFSLDLYRSWIEKIKKINIFTHKKQT